MHKMYINLDNRYWEFMWIGITPSLYVYDIWSPYEDVPLSYFLTKIKGRYHNV